MKTGSERFTLLGAVLGGFMAGVLAANGGSSVWAATDQRSPIEIELNGEKVLLGSAKAAVITRLSKQFILENSGKFVNGAEFWFVKSKGEEPAALGSLQFKKDVLVTATREWGQLEPDLRTLAFMKSFYGAVERVFGGRNFGHVVCTLKREPGNEHFQIDLVRPGRNASFVFIEATAAGSFRSAFVQESVSK